MAEVRPNRGGDPFVVTLDHELTLIATPGHSRPSRRGGQVVDVPVRDWLEWPAGRRGVFKLFRVGVESFDNPGLGSTDLDPYFLGMLLGDGCLRGRVSVTTADNEIVEEFARQAELFGLEVRRDEDRRSTSDSYRMVGARGRANPVASQLRSYGLYGCRSGEKFIPDKYLVASRDDRLELLAGLMDTDGNASNGAGFDYVSKSAQLAGGVAFLARSLGLAATVGIKMVASDEFHRVYLGGEVSQVPVRLARKKLNRVVKHRPTVAGFAVEELGEEDYYGITVKGGRYLLGDFTVTHNSGKTAGFQRRVRLAKIAGRKTMVVKPERDDRDGLDVIVTHDKVGEECRIAADAAELLALLLQHKPEVLGVDEAQFFGKEIVSLLLHTAKTGTVVIVAGLDLDFAEGVFQVMAELAALAEKVTKLNAVCTGCGGYDASRSLRTRGGNNIVQIGGAEAYAARCLHCYTEETV